MSDRLHDPCVEIFALNLDCNSLLFEVFRAVGARLFMSKTLRRHGGEIRAALLENLLGWNCFVEDAVF